MTLPDGIDVLVIGAGMAGLSVAAELGRRQRRSVVVLDAGPDRGHRHVRATHPRDAATQLCLHPATDADFWRPYRSAGDAYRGLAGLRRRVGGRSLYWGGVLLPIEPWALADGWPPAVATELTSRWDGGPGLYERVLDDVERWGADLLTGEGIEVAGLAFDHTPHAVRSEEGGRWSAFSPLAWWDADHGDPAVRSIPIVAAQTALGVLVERGRAVGARVGTAEGGAHDLRASRVVLAAGTVENSRLALQALADADPASPRELPGLVDKVAQGFTCTFPDPDRLPPAVRAAARVGNAYHRIGGAEARSNHFVRFVEREHGAVTLDSWLLGEQQRSPASRVTCAAGPWPWTTTVESALGPADDALRLAQQDVLRRFWTATAEAFGVQAPDLDFATEHGSRDLVARLTAQAPAPQSYSFPLGEELHEAGTTALGELAGEDHQLRDVEGLYVCGPSTFPRTGAANPSMTTLALGRRLGAILSG